MARLPRIVVPGQPLHIIQRGNNRQSCFFADDDHCFYLASLKDAADRYGCRIHAYVLMTNHVHLLLTPDSIEAPSLTLQSVGRRYVRYVNAVYRRSGTLWEARYKPQIHSERLRALSPCLQPLHRAQSDPCPDGQGPRRLPVVELPF